MTVRGRAWSVRWRSPGPDAVGLCDPATRTITIQPGLDDRAEIATVCDEICHAAFPDLDNEAVDGFSDAAADLLIRLGYRKGGDDE